MFSPGCMKRASALILLLAMSPVLLASPPPTAPAVAGTWQPRTSAFARISARQQAVLRLPFAVQITALHAEPGMAVQAGDELARFDAPRLRKHLAAWWQARREQALAGERLRMLREGEKAHAVTRRDLARGKQAMAEAAGRARLAWETLAADLDLLHVSTEAPVLAKRIDRQGLAVVARDLGRLQAPFAGIVTARRVALGEQLTAGDPVLELEALDTVYVDVGVPEKSLAAWQGGAAQWRDGEQRRLLQRVGGVPLYDADTGLWWLRYQAANPQRRLRDGAWIEVEHLGAARPVVWVPAAAVVARNGKLWCIVQHDGRFEPVAIQAGAGEDGRIPVLSGLAAGDRVVTRGAYELLYRDLKELIRFED